MNPKNIGSYMKRKDEEAKQREPSLTARRRKMRRCPPADEKMYLMKKLCVLRIWKQTSGYRPLTTNIDCDLKMARKADNNRVGSKSVLRNNMFIWKIKL